MRILLITRPKTPQHMAIKRAKLLLLILCFWATPKVIGQSGNGTASPPATPAMGGAGNGAVSSSSSRPSSVNIGVLFTYNSAIGRSAMPAIFAAVEDVNADSTVLRGTKLNVFAHDTNCSGFLGTVDGNSFTLLFLLDYLVYSIVLMFCLPTVLRLFMFYIYA